MTQGPGHAGLASYAPHAPSPHPLQTLEARAQDSAVLLRVVLVVAGVAALADQLLCVRAEEVHVLMHLRARHQMSLWVSALSFRHEARHK